MVMTYAQAWLWPWFGQDVAAVELVGQDGTGRDGVGRGGVGWGGASGRANGLFASGVAALCEAFALLPALATLELGSERHLHLPAASTDPSWVETRVRFGS